MISKPYKPRICVSPGRAINRYWRTFLDNEFEFVMGCRYRFEKSRYFRFLLPESQLEQFVGYSSVDNYDLIHSYERIPINGKTPYVISTESFRSCGPKWHPEKIRKIWYQFPPSFFFNHLSVKYLESERCRKILTFSGFARKNGLAKISSKKIRDKIEVLYPGVLVDKKLPLH